MSVRPGKPWGPLSVTLTVSLFFSGALPLTATPKTSGKADFVRGEGLLKQRKAAEAFDAFTRALILEPGNKNIKRRKLKLGSSFQMKRF